MAAPHNSNIPTSLKENTTKPLMAIPVAATTTTMSFVSCGDAPMEPSMATPTPSSLLIPMTPPAISLPMEMKKFTTQRASASSTSIKLSKKTKLEKKNDDKELLMQLARRGIKEHLNLMLEQQQRASEIAEFQKLMGRSRGNFQSNEDLIQRSKTNKNTSIGENSEAPAGQGSDGGKRAFFHCNYCNKDITGKVHIKCAICHDFDLCVECFSSGAEVRPHKSNHPYRVMSNLSFPLLCPDWNAEEEILLLEGIEMYGFGDWAEIAEHAGTKSKEQCLDHYTTAYLNDPHFPLSDMSHVAGENREKPLADKK